MSDRAEALYNTFRVVMEQLSPRPLEAALVSFDGLPIARYPVNPNEVWHEERERLSAVSVAMISFSARICKEMRTGEWHESIIRAATGIIIIVGVNDKILLSIRFPIVASINNIRSQLYAAIIAIKYQKPRDFTFKTAVERLSPRPKMAAILSIDGSQDTTYPVNADTYNELRQEENRKSAMSAAILSLGERITEELRNGEVRETIVRGTDGIIIEMAIGDKAILVATFTSIPSLDDMRLQLLNLIDELKQKPLSP